MRKVYKAMSWRAAENDSLVGMEYKDYDLMAANVSVGCDGLVSSLTSSTD